MTAITIKDIQKNIDSFLQKVENGESLVIFRSGLPLAEIKPVKEKEKKLRPYGLCKGEIYISENFNDPLPDEILDAFERKE